MNKRTNNNNKKKQKKKNNKIIQLLTVVHELLTLGCSLIHVLQAPHTHPYQNQELDGLGLYVMLSLLIDKMMLGLTPLHCLSETTGM